MDRHARTGRPRSGGTGTIVLVLIVVVLLVASGVVLRTGGEESGDAALPDLFEVQRGSFDIAIPASGELAALKQIEISSQLETRAVITEIIDEGKMVSAGDVLIRLDDEDITTRIEDAKLAVDNAETAWATAGSNLKIRQDANVSQLALADVDIRLAELALQAWQEGTDVAKREELDLEVKTSEREFMRLEARLENSVALLAQEFISQDEFERDEIEKIRAESRYKQSVRARDVYESIEREAQLEKLNADLKKVLDKRSETAQRNTTEIESLVNAVENKLVSLRRERDRLEKAERQLTDCTITAPQDGLVVYASSLSTGRGWRNNEEAPQIGTELRRNRTVIILPDTSVMVAEVKVNEALSGKIQPGQTAIVHSDALPDTTLNGEVTSVGVLAESGGWRDPNRRDYTVTVRLADGAGLGLKPSMRCRASIYVGRVNDALFVPIQAVFRGGAVAYVYVPDGGSYDQRAVSLGRSSELYIEILDGLESGNLVLLRKPADDRIGDRAADGGDGRPSANGNGWGGAAGQGKGRGKGRSSGGRSPGAGKAAGKATSKPAG